MVNVVYMDVKIPIEVALFYDSERKRKRGNRNLLNERANKRKQLDT